MFGFAAFAFSRSKINLRGPGIFAISGGGFRRPPLAMQRIELAARLVD
jgi:hypothetical protein